MGVFSAHRLASYFSLLVVLGLLPAPAATALGSPPPLRVQPLLLDVAAAGQAFVAVGDHGVALRSDDQGATWAPAITPVQTLLTAVSFADADHGWAVGHDGVILHTNDGGRTWQRQDDGQATDAIYLDVLFLDARHGFIAGAYGKFLTTDDGGQTWIASHPQSDEPHYNRLSASAGGTLYLAGEGGTMLLSRDQGKTWQRRDVPYDGSLFGVLPLAKDNLLVYGLRGHILRSGDQGTTWTPEHSAVKVLIMAGLKMKNGVVVLAGQAGNFFLSHDAGQTFLPWKPADFDTSVAELIETRDGALLALGEAGATIIRLP